MVFPPLFWILASVSLVMCLVGFYRFSWFTSVGHALTAAGCGAALLVNSLLQGVYTLPYALLCAVLTVYGLRLGVFLLVRDFSEPFKRVALDLAAKQQDSLEWSLSAWMLVSVLHPLLCAGPLYRLANGRTEADLFLWVGTGLALLGLLIETEADREKFAAKKKCANLPAMRGLYRLCRCPNYLGELLFWTGLLVSGLSCLRGWQWLTALGGYALVVAVVLRTVRQLESRQQENYGGLRIYQQYAARTGLLFPWRDRRPAAPSEA